MNRLYFLAVSSLTVLAVVQALRQLPGMPRDGVSKLVDSPTGARLNSLVVSSQHVGPLALSDVGSGTCRYIVIYSHQCGASRTLARQWYQQLFRERGEPFPHDWTVIWASVTDSAAGAGFFPHGFPLDAVFAAAGSRLAEEAGVHAYPAHIVLDRAGVVRSGEVGARLLPRTAFRSDCSVRIPSSR